MEVMLKKNNLLELINWALETPSIITTRIQNEGFLSRIEFLHRVRLHFWAPEIKSLEGSDESGIHNHKAIFVTHCLYGGYDHKIFEKSSPESNKGKELKRFEKINNEFLMTGNPVRMEVKSQITLSDGKGYLISNELFHSI